MPLWMERLLFSVFGAVGRRIVLAKNIDLFFKLTATGYVCNAVINVFTIYFSELYHLFDCTIYKIISEKNDIFQFKPPLAT